MQGVVFVSGAVQMALEIVGSRILAPYFGNSIFVWGSLISVFLASLSVGYFVGGTYADRRPTLGTLAVILAIPGAMITLLPWFTEPINSVLADADIGPRLGPLLASLLLFFAPSVFLGMVSPFAIKLKVKQLETVGNTAGSLYAISTLGSIVGTLGTSFFLITWLGVRLIVHVLGLILLLLAGVVAGTARASASTISPREGKRSTGKPQSTRKSKDKQSRTKAARRFLVLLAVSLVLQTTGTSAAFPDLYASRKVYEKDSLYHNIKVVDEGGVRYLRFDASWQSAMDLRDPDRLVFDYTEYFHLGPLFCLDARTALFVGLGGGSVPKNFRRNYPHLVMDVAEIDPEVIRVAERFFDLKEDAQLRLSARDGRAYLRKNKNRYDLVFLDAYFADAIPFHLTTREYLEELVRHMEPGGVVVSNVIGAISGPKSRLFRSMLKTYQQVLHQVFVFPVGWNGASRAKEVVRNIIVVGMVGKDAPDMKALTLRAREQAAALTVPCDLPALLANRFAEPINTGDVPVLTDDYAPVDSLMHF